MKIVLVQGWRTYGTHPQNGTRKISLSRGIQCCFNYFHFPCPTNLPTLWGICLYLHISGGVQNVYGLLLLPNNKTNETFLHNSRAVWSVEWIFIIGSQVWQYLGEYVTWDTTSYSTRSTPLTQVSKWEPHEHLLRRTSAVVRIILLTLCLDWFVSGQLIPSDKHP